MRKLGVLLALLVFGSLLTVGTGTVSAGSAYTLIVDTDNASAVLDYLVNGTWQGYKPSFTYEVADTGRVIIHADSIKDYVRLLIPQTWSSSSYSLSDFGTIYGDPAGTVVYVTTGTANKEDKSITYQVNATGQAYVFAWVVKYDKWFELYAEDGKGTKYYMLQNTVGTVTEWMNINGTVKQRTHDDDADEPPSVSANAIFYPGVMSVSVTTNSGGHVLTVQPITYQVAFHVKDALTGESLTGVAVKENGQVLGTVDDGGTLELSKGQHMLTFEKNGYWSTTKTVDVQGDMSVSVQMYPSSAAFKLENFPSDISIPENTIYTLTFTLSPIETSATYNTYLSISGLQNLIEVQKGGKTVSPESGKYYLGDISGPTQVSIRFKAGAVGQHGFTIAVESHDAIQSKTYTTTKQVTYQVEPLPFNVQMPSEWQVGQNELRISESSGQSYLITAVLKDSQGNEVWSDSHAFSPYEAYSFSVNVPKEGSYTLELQFQGKIAVYDVTVNPAITLVTKALTVQEGGEGAIVLHFKNPSSSVQYYTIEVSGGFLPSKINQSISVAPLAEKNVSIAFAVPDHLEYDAYELNVVVDQGNAQVFQDKVAVSISGGSSGFHLLGGGNSHGRVFIYLLAGLLVAGLAVVMTRRR